MLEIVGVVIAGITAVLGSLAMFFKAKASKADAAKVDAEKRRDVAEAKTSATETRAEVAERSTADLIQLSSKQRKRAAEEATRLKQGRRDHFTDTW